METYKKETLLIVDDSRFQRVVLKEMLSDKFNLKNFHQYILDMGPVQFDILFNNLDAWIKKEK